MSVETKKRFTEGNVGNEEPGVLRSLCCLLFNSVVGK